MIKKLLFTALLVFSANAFAQIGTFPATESFDAVFTEGTDVMFIPNWTGNTVNPTATATRIFRNETDFNSAPAALSVIPTSAFNGDIRVSLDMTAAQSISFNFLAKSMLNGDGTRDVVLTMETSVDGGTTWIGSQQIASLPNADQAAFTAFNYALPAAANNQSNVIVRFYVTRGTTGTSTAAKLVIDDVVMAQLTTPQVSVSQTALNFSQTAGSPSPSQEITVSGVNLTDNIMLTATTDFEISLLPDSGYTNNLVLTMEQAAVAETTVYVRMNAAIAGASAGTLTLSTAGANDTIITLSGNNVAVNLTNPEPLHIPGNEVIFSAWDPASAINTFPEHMAFWTHGVTDPDLNTPFTEDWHCLYNLAARSRFSGEGDNGVSFVNTGNSQFTGVCDGSDPTQATGPIIENGRAGAVVLSMIADQPIGTGAYVSADLTWTARTILKNNRVYGLRLQYRIGTNNANPNEGWTEFDTPQDYTSGDDNTSQDFVTQLPGTLLNEQEGFQLRWVYYYISGTGSRAQLALDDIGVSNIVLGNEDFQLNDRFSFYPNPVNGNLIHFNVASDIVISDISGKQIITAENTTDLDVSKLASGVYFIRNAAGKVLKMMK